MTNQQSLALAQIRAAGRISAVDLGHRCCLPLESLYDALIPLEARGLVRVDVDYKQGAPREALWTTMGSGDATSYSI